MVEYLQTDFWVRHQKMKGKDCIYICGEDTHGTPVMMSAMEQQINPEKLIAKSQEERLKDFADFGVNFDHYSSTNSSLNKDIVEEVYKTLKKNDHVSLKVIKQLYCNNDKMFLPDRFVKGVCPSCNSADQYGDSCDKCGATYSTLEVIEPRCSLCGSTPIEKESEHVFVKLNEFNDFLKKWTKDHTSIEVYNKLKEWTDEELKDWDISRDEPYFGFEIPGHKEKYFYVWVDAPCGYIAFTKEWCEKNQKDFDYYWKNPDAEIYHFIGKDIVYFHALFWPALLKNTSYTLPKEIFVHGFLKVNGEKMSKSKGTFIKARTYLDYLDPMYLRYYFACKLNSGLSDLDLNFSDFVQRVNSDLIGKITNLGSRSGQMLNKKLDGVIGSVDQKGQKVIDFSKFKKNEIIKHYDNRDFGKAMETIRGIADHANAYFDKEEPWKVIKEEPEKARVVLSSILNVFRDIAIYLQPVLPEYSSKAAALFHEDKNKSENKNKDVNNNKNVSKKSKNKDVNKNGYSFDSLEQTLEGVKINNYEHLAKRVDLKNTPFEKL